MAMALVWHDLKSFQRHLEDMKTFRQWHQNNRRPTLLKDMPVPAYDSLRSEAGGTGDITNTRGYPAIPIWEITLSRNSQN